MTISAQKLGLAMARQGVSGGDLVARARVSPRTLAKARAGGEVRPAVVGKLAVALAVDPAELVDLAGVGAA